MHRLVWMLVLSLFAVTAFSGCYQQIQARKELKKGNEYYKQEAYKDALEQFKKGLELDPEATFAWRSLGLSAMALVKPGDTRPENMEYAKTAVDAFQKYMDAFPKDDKVLDYLITTYLNAQMYNEAIEYIQNYRKLHPEAAKLLQPLVMLMVRAGKIEDAYQLALKDAPDNSVIFYTIAFNAWAKSYYDPTMEKPARKKLVDLGLRSVIKSLELKPDFSEMAYINLLYRERGKLETEVDKQNLWKAGADAWGKKAVKLRDEQKRLEELRKQQEQPAEQKSEGSESKS